MQAVMPEQAEMRLTGAEPMLPYRLGCATVRECRLRLGRAG